MHLGPARSASPATGVLRGLRATVLAVLCVLLPPAGHALAQGHAPRPVIVAGIAAVAVPGAVTLTRRRLTDAQALAVLTAAQLACHAAYSLPGACRTTADSAVTPGGLPAAVEHGAAAGPPAGVLLAGHLVTLAVGARLLGITERLLWQSRPLLLAVGHLLLFAWPLTGTTHHQGPRATVRESASPPEVGRTGTAERGPRPSASRARSVHPPPADADRRPLPALTARREGHRAPRRHRAPYVPASPPGTPKAP